MVLEGTNPNVYQSICQSLSTVNKIGWKFSSIAFDQAHERLNEPMKGDGGGVGLTENPIKLRRWMTAGPDTACMIEECEKSYLMPKEQRHIHLARTGAIPNMYSPLLPSLRG